MHNVLTGLRVVEGSAFVAAPSGGMTLAQLGADVIRFDPIGGGIDHRRWPVTEDNTSLYWAGLNKGKRSLQVDVRSPAGRELLTDLICAPGPGAGIFLTNFPATGWMAYETLRARRDDLIMLAITGNHDGTTAVDYTVNCAVGYPMVTGHASVSADDEERGADDRPVNHVLPAWDLLCGQTAALGLLAAERHRTAPERANSSRWRCRTWRSGRSRPWAMWPRHRSSELNGRGSATTSTVPWVETSAAPTGAVSLRWRSAPSSGRRCAALAR